MVRRGVPGLQQDRAARARLHRRAHVVRAVAAGAGRRGARARGRGRRLASARAGLVSDADAGAGGGVVMTDAPLDEPVRLGALEQQVMSVLWDEGPSTVRDVITHIGG